MTEKARADSEMDKKRGRELGMDQAIDRRDFLNGMAVGAAAFSTGLAQAAPAHQSTPQDRPGYYPPRQSQRGTGALHFAGVCAA